MAKLTGYSSLRTALQNFKDGELTINDLLEALEHCKNLDEHYTVDRPFTHYVYNHFEILVGRDYFIAIELIKDLPISNILLYKKIANCTLTEAKKYVDGKEILELHIPSSVMKEILSILLLNGYKILSKEIVS